MYASDRDVFGGRFVCYLMATGLFDRSWSVILGNLVLNRSTTLFNAVTSFQKM